jgi:HlyD family secretion protein
MVDIARDPSFARNKRLRRGLAIGIAAIVVAAISVGLARMQPGAPTVERATLLIDTVKRGSIVREVRGLGTLVPEDTRWLPALTEGRVERIVLRPGARVTPESVILELSNPQVTQDAVTAQLSLQSAQAALENLRVQADNDLLTQQSQVAALDAEYAQARMDADANESLAAEKLVSSLVLRQSQVKADSLKTRLELEKRRLASATDSLPARIRVQQTVVDQARAAMRLQEDRLAALKVRPGFSGVLQQVPVDVGQRVAAGTNLARVADPGRLKAELKIPETQAKDIEPGQPAAIDTRNGIIAGIVSRKDPAATNGTVTVDVRLTEELPRGAVPDLSVDGTIQLEHLTNVLFVGRPAFGQDQAAVGLFKLVGDSGLAERVQVRLGGSSVNAVEVTSGLRAGDQVVLSDMSAWDGSDRIRLR